MSFGIRATDDHVRATNAPEPPATSLAGLDLTDPSLTRLIVTGHPNHELAIFGFVQRLRPHLLFLTDGGGQERVEESRQALESIGLLDRAHFLNWTEKSLYDALLLQDIGLFRELVREVRDELIRLDPQQIFCEGVEWYNPLHDITLPVVHAAALALPGIEIVEFPLIAQEPAPEERYRVQRFAAGRSAVSIQLEPPELAAKLYARDHFYGTLRRTTGSVLDTVSSETSAAEFFSLALDETPMPGRDHVLRYEWRARLLHEQGEIDKVITFAGHYLPLVEALRMG